MKDEKKIDVIWERGQEGGKTRPINQEILFNNTVEVSRCLTKHGIKHWMSHGTMLGLYRDGHVIPWDDDVDISCDMKDRDEIEGVMKEMREAGFFVPDQGDPEGFIDSEHMPYYDTVFIRDGEKIECWWFERLKRNDNWWYIYDEPRCGNILRHPARYYNEIQFMEFRGVELPVPNHIEDWIVMMYGENWKTPNKFKKYNHQR